MTTLYVKRGRRYYPVSERDEYESFPQGAHLVICEPGSRLTRFNVNPDRAGLLAAPVPAQPAAQQVTDAMVSAALCSQARDDEGEFPVMIDLLDFSGENKSRTAMRHALECALLYAPYVKEPHHSAVPEAVAKDAARYRWLRDRNNSLETRQYDKGVYNGPSCYHEVEGIRELKSESKLDDAIDAAILSATDTEGRKDGT